MSNLEKIIELQLTGEQVVLITACLEYAADGRDKDDKITGMIVDTHNLVAEQVNVQIDDPSLTYTANGKSFGPKLPASAYAYDVLEWFISRYKLLSGRWPCPDCGRENADAPLRSVEVHHSNMVHHVGCWRCNLEPILESAEKVVESHKAECSTR